MKKHMIRILTATGLVLCLSFLSSTYIIKPTASIVEPSQPSYEIADLTAADQSLSPVSRGSERRLPVNPPVMAEPKAPALKAQKISPSQELDLLARLITAEAQAEPYEAKVAVGAVVMNRVKSGEFPNSISKVIYQKINGYDQFTPVVNGWINKPAQADCIKAAKEAMNGSDPSGGALFYYDNKSTNPWMLEKPVSTQIGNMIFAY